MTKLLIYKGCEGVRERESADGQGSDRRKSAYWGLFTERPRVRGHAVAFFR